MRNNIQIFGYFIIVGLMLSSCKDDSIDTSSRDNFIVSIAKSWTVDESAYILLDNEDITQALYGFEITIDEALNYTTNSSSMELEVMPWPSSGSFTINEELTHFTRNDGLVIMVATDENGQLTLDFQFIEGYDDSSGRTEGIRGNWTMNLSAL